MKKYVYSLIMFVAFFGSLAVFTLFADNDARGIREGLLRFHVIGASDSERDQQLKFAVRDGIAELCSSLFDGQTDKDKVMEIAEQNKQEIARKAEQILSQNGCDDKVSVTVTKRFFPTRHYEGVSLPAGVYDALDVKIGKAEGRNFWCVMFPDICLGVSSSKTNKDKLGDVLEGGSLDMATDKKTPSVQLKFKAVEVFQTLKNYLFSKK